jgi:CPA1 family monovalent cation:H+ antiporter
VLAIARHLHVPELLLLFGAGVLASFVPGLPSFRTDPNLVLNLFLPPLLYASTVRVSWELLRFAWLPGIVLGAALVLATIGAVAVATRVFLPGMSWPTALLLGIVVSVFDTRLFHEGKGRARVPRAIADTLKARELVARIIILASFSLVLEAAMSSQASIGLVLDRYLLDIPAGVLLGFAVGHAVAWARQRIDPAPVEIAVSMATPYAAALTADALGISIVAAITTAALVISAVRIDRRTGAPMSSSETRVSATAFWEEISLMISSAVFFLAGWALPEALAGLEDWRPSRLGAAALGILLVVLGVQFAFSFPATLLSPLAGSLPARAVGARSTAAAVMAWGSTRSVLGIIIALAIPAALPDGRPFPDRDLVLLVGAIVIVSSVFLQSLTLNAAVKLACIGDEKERSREEALARDAMASAAATPRAEHANGFDAARQDLLALRRTDQIGDEVLISMLRETDLNARAAEGNALPGAGPPNP